MRKYQNNNKISKEDMILKEISRNTKLTIFSVEILASENRSSMQG